MQWLQICMNICKGSHLDGTMLLGRLLVLSVLILNRLLPRHENKLCSSSTIIMLTCLTLIYAWEVIIFVCLGFSSHSRIVHSYGEVTFAGEGLQILTYARQYARLGFEHATFRLGGGCSNPLRHP